MVAQWPERFAGLGTLPMQDVNAAIAELERIMVSLGFKGAMINDHINGQSLDAPEFLPFWKAAEQLGALILFHQGGEQLSAHAFGATICPIPLAIWPSVR